MDEGKEKVKTQEETAEQTTVEPAHSNEDIQKAREHVIRETASELKKRLKHLSKKELILLIAKMSVNELELREVIKQLAEKLELAPEEK